METTKDAAKNALKDAAEREQAELRAASEPPQKVAPTESVHPEELRTADPLEETVAEKVIEEELLSDVTDEEAHANDTAEKRKVHIEFPGSDILRAQVPKAFEVAEAVAEDWVNDGRFEGLPLGHPLAQLGAQMGLRKAKDLEKKLEEKGVFMLAKVGLEYLKSKTRKTK